MRRAVAAGAAALLLVLLSEQGAPAAPVPAKGTRATEPTAVQDMRVLGTTREDRRIFAYRVGDPTARRTAVVMSTMHGNERDTVDIVRNLRDGRPIHGIDLWLVPVYNPDGYASYDRHNSRDVDLNRNYPVGWKPLDANYESGRKPASERETRIFMRFMNRVDPDLVVSFHQPLDGIDIRDAKRPAFVRTLAHELRLPLTRIDCNGRCHGTMTQWFNARHPGFALTVELPANPSQWYLDHRGPRGLLRALGAWRR